MRDDELDLGIPPTDDRPGDSWFPQPFGAEESQKRFLTWHGRRRRWVLVAGVLSVLMIITTFFLVPWSVIFKPGPLSQPHAQILTGTMVSQRCASCHTQSALNPLSIFSFGSTGDLRDAHNMSQSDLCMECHKQTIPPSLASNAHNLPLSVRDKLTDSIRQVALSVGQDLPLTSNRWIPDAAVDQNDVQCSACHKEHHGSTADLLGMSNEQCQTCHSQRFNHFAQDHPDWQQWPYERGGEIAFNHGSHSSKHYPNWKDGSITFDCGTCHAESNGVLGISAIPTGELLRSASFETSCTKCHDESMRVQLASGMDLIALPMIPSEIAEKLTGWPEASTGFADGVIPPLTELLIRTDASMNELLERIPEGNLGRLPESSARSRETLRRVAEETQRLIDDIARIGQDAISDRLSHAGLSIENATPFLNSFSPQMARTAKRSWELGTAPRSITDPLQVKLTRGKVRLVLADDGDLLGGNLLGGNLLQDDPLLDDPLASDPLMEDPLMGDPLLEDSLSNDPLQQRPLSQQPKPKSPSELVSFGGWYRDDLRLSLRYRATSHSDAVMASVIDLFAQLSEKDPLKQRFFEQTAVSACVSCHSASASAPSQWKSHPRVGDRGEFTKFSHQPHLNVSSLGDCQHCHRINVDESHTDFVHDFKTLGRETCAACHTTAAAGDNCTTCHRYHIDWRE